VNEWLKKGLAADTLAGSDPTLELQQELARYLQAHPPEEHDLSRQPDVVVKVEPQDGNGELIINPLMSVFN